MLKVNFRSLIRTFVYSKFNVSNLFRCLREFYFIRNRVKSNTDLNFFPILNDYSPNHEIDYHYTYHPAWALRVLLSYDTSIHIDLASKLDFALSASAFMKVEYHDYRNVSIKFNNFKSVFTDISKLPFENDSVQSLSCMHVLEHIGLGRYGDPIDLGADEDTAREIVRVVAKNGHFIFVTPLANKYRLEFNAHRVYTYENVVSNLFKEFQLLEFSVVTDDGEFILNSDSHILTDQSYACGCFHFIKP